MFRSSAAVLTCVLFLAAIPQAFAEGEKLPVPGASAQDEARRTILEVHDTEYRQAKTPAQKVEFAQKLITEGRETKDDSAGQYVLFLIARDVAVKQGDAYLALSAINEIARFFQVDGPALKATALSAVAKTATSTAQNEDLANAALDALDAEAAAGNFDAARELVLAAQSAARKLRDPQLVKRITARSKTLDDEKKSFQLVKQAIEKLKGTPTDAKANRIVGKYRCFVLDDWGTGLPMLAIGDDTGFKSVARTELTPPTDLGEQVALGDAWWQLSETGEARDKQACQTRARKWYSLAMPSTTGLVKAKIEKRMAASKTPERNVTRKIRFASPKVLAQFVGPENPDTARGIVDGRLVLSGKDKFAMATFREPFQSISKVTIHGAIIPPAELGGGGRRPPPQRRQSHTGQAIRLLAGRLPHHRDQAGGSTRAGLD